MSRPKVGWGVTVATFLVFFVAMLGALAGDWLVKKNSEVK